MVQIQLDLAEEEDYQLDIFRAQERLENKKDAIRKILREKFKLKEIKFNT